jgi:hypothetical protein
MAGGGEWRGIVSEGCVFQKLGRGTRWTRSSASELFE